MAKGRWIKVYTKVIWDSSVRELTCTQKWIFLTLLILADNNQGKIQGDDARESYIALAAGTDAKIIRKSLGKIVDKSLIIQYDNGDIEICNWYKYQSTTAKRDKTREGQNAPLEEEVDKIRRDKKRIDKIKDIDFSFISDKNLKVEIQKTIEILAKIPGATPDKLKHTPTRLVEYIEKWPDIDPVKISESMLAYFSDNEREIKNISSTIRRWFENDYKYENCWRDSWTDNPARVVD